MDPLVPLRVSCSVWLLILRFEHGNDLAFGVAGKVAARAALGYHVRVKPLLDCYSDAVDNVVKLILGHDAGLGPGQGFCSDGPDALGGLEYRVVYLEPLLLPSAALSTTTLEF